MFSNVIIKYISTIVKTIAASSALFITSILSVYLFDFDMKYLFLYYLIIFLINLLFHLYYH